MTSLPIRETIVKVLRNRALLLRNWGVNKIIITIYSGLIFRHLNNNNYTHTCHLLQKRSLPPLSATFTAIKIVARVHIESLITSDFLSRLRRFENGKVDAAGFLGWVNLSPERGWSNYMPLLKITYRYSVTSQYFTGK